MGRAAIGGAYSQHRRPPHELQNSSGEVDLEDQLPDLLNRGGRQRCGILFDLIACDFSPFLIDPVVMIFLGNNTDSSRQTHMRTSIDMYLRLRLSPRRVTNTRARVLTRGGHAKTGLWSQPDGLALTGRRR